MLKICRQIYIKKLKMNSKNNLSSIRQACADTLIKLATDNPKLYVVSADLKSSLLLGKFASKFRHRFIECGVAENNAAGVAAGLSRSGKTVFLVSYACFSPGINWTTIKQSICYNRLNVKIIGSHGGLMTMDLGATHQMLEDIALMRSLPGMEVFAPLDALETAKIITAVAFSRSPSYIRLVRPSTPLFFDHSLKFTIGKSQILKTGKDVTVLGYGPILLGALRISNYSLEVINCSSIKPLDSVTILKSIKKTGRCLVIEDHQKIGGLGEAVASLILSSGLKCKFVHLAVDNQFGRSGKDYNELYDYYNIGQKSLINAIKKIL
jgi:transketolase